MMSPNERCLNDAGGNQHGVFLNMTDYQKILEALEALKSIRAYDAAAQRD